MPVSVEARAACIAKDRILEFWPKIRPLVKEAVTRGGISDFSAIQQDVIDGKAPIWFAWVGNEARAVAVTQVCIANGRKFCLIVACHGTDRTGWLHLLSDLENYARTEGCAAMKIVGRPGWSRLLPEYRVTSVVLEKELR